MRVTVDDDLCCGHGACTALCPEVFSINDGGYAEAITADIDPSLQSAVNEAIICCPERAIHAKEQTCP
jgi:ferredoxin